ncbi:serine transporter [Burkholderia pseudomallei]|nr:serine transporter [Burkholderia pseudomallei]MCD4522216.1 serine transporter [Burkholderia pseudomallei]MCW0027341.1 serine transporter [Burkholderia pseudomallei]MCW0133732.1 serine transporter [Burkholderia pseudomallei]MCW0143624.1 serine transporter [Burkholderia pseudomallei]MCW0160649.1 serine transporter [Burkholderia pseudomallei]
MAGLNVTTLMHGVRPQGRLRTVTRCVLEFAVLQHNFDSACKRLHRNLKATRQAGLVVSRLEHPPKLTSIVEQSIASVESLRQIKSRKAPIAPLRIRCLVVAVQTSRDIVDVANPVKRQLFHHQARDDLRLAASVMGGGFTPFIAVALVSFGGGSWRVAPSRRRVSGGRLPRLDARRRADARRPSASPTRVASRLRMSKTPLDRRDWIVGFEKSLAILEAFDTSKAWVAAIDNGSRT